MAMSSYRFGQSQAQSSYDAGGDQGTWQSPFQSDAYYTGAPQNYFTNPPLNSGNTYSGQNSGGSSGSASGLSLGSGLNGGGSTSNTLGLSSLSSSSGNAASGSAYNTGISNFKNSSGFSSKNSGQQNSSFIGSQMNSSMQDMGYGNQNQDDGHSQMGYYGNADSYDNSGIQGNMMGLNSGNIISNDNSNGSNSLNMMGYNNNMNMMGMGNNGSNNIMGSGNDIMGMGSGNNILGSNSGGNISNEMQSQIMAAAAGLGAMSNWQNDFGNNQFNANFNKRGRRRGRGGMFGPYGNRFFYGQNSSGHGDQTIHLNATNYNQWGYLRKDFNKRDDELMEHLYEIHEKFCHRCRDRLEEKQASKKRKYQEVVPGKVEDEPAPQEETEVEEELTEEELEMKKLMGFAGFKSTKGSRVKDNSYKTVSSVNCNNEDKGESDEGEDQTSSLTAEEKKMIASIGGFSVFTKDAAEEPKTNVGFGAPAVTMQPMEGSAPGYSDAPLFDTEKEGNTA